MHLVLRLRSGRKLIQIVVKTLEGKILEGKVSSAASIAEFKKVSLAEQRISTKGRLLFQRPYAERL